MPTDFDRADNLDRPPLVKSIGATTKPLIVTGTFVSRVDKTGRGERPLDAGSSTSKHGHGIHFPNWPLVLADPAAKQFVRRYAQLHNIGSTQKRSGRQEDRCRVDLRVRVDERCRGLPGQ